MKMVVGWHGGTGCGSIIGWEATMNENKKLKHCYVSLLTTVDCSNDIVHRFVFIVNLLPVRKCQASNNGGSDPSH